MREKIGNFWDQDPTLPPRGDQAIEPVAQPPAVPSTQVVPVVAVADTAVTTQPSDPGGINLSSPLIIAALFIVAAAMVGMFAFGHRSAAAQVGPTTTVTAQASTLTQLPPPQQNNQIVTVTQTPPPVTSFATTTTTATTTAPPVTDTKTAPPVTATATVTAPPVTVTMTTVVTAGPTK